MYSSTVPGDEGQPPPRGGRTPPGRSEAFLHGLRRPLVEARPWPADPIRRRRMRDVVLETHRFLHRSLRYAADGTADGTTGGQAVHQVVAVGAAEASHCAVCAAVRQADPAARVAVLPTDAMVLAARNAMLGERSEGRARIEPDRLVADDLMRVAERDGVDLSRPAALLLVGILHHVVADRAARELVARLVAAMAPGSVVVVSHLSAEHPSPGLGAAVRAYERAGVPVRLRGRAEVGRLLTGLDLVEPGVELVSSWRRDLRDGPVPAPEQVASWGAVAHVR